MNPEIGSWGKWEVYWIHAKQTRQEKERRVANMAQLETLLPILLMKTTPAQGFSGVLFLNTTCTVELKV